MLDSKRHVHLYTDIKRKVLCFSVLFLVLYFSAQSTNAATISGNIALPNAQTASGSMFFSVSATYTSGSLDANNRFHFSNVSLSQHGTDIDFSIDIPDEANATWRIRVGCFDNFPACRDYVLTSYYDTNSTGNANYLESAATPVAQNTSNVNLAIARGHYH